MSLSSSSSSSALGASRCPQCDSSIARGQIRCRNCGERQSAPAAQINRRQAARDSEHAESPASDLEAQRIEVAAKEEEEDLATLNELTDAPLLRRREVLRVSPFVFFIIPAIFFYCSAVLASYTAHFGSNTACPDSLGSFLWGAVIIGYLFVLGFAWMIVGPKVDSLPLKWSAILIFTLLLGVLTALGGRELVDGDTSEECVRHKHTRAALDSFICMRSAGLFSFSDVRLLVGSFSLQTSSAWFKTCAVITVFYIIFWVCLSFFVIREVCVALCCPPRERVIIMGIGAGFNKLHLKPLKRTLKQMMDTLPKKKKKKKNELTESSKKPVGGLVDLPPADTRSKAEIEFALLEHATAVHQAAEVKKDNFFGSALIEKRRGTAQADEPESTVNSARAPLTRLKTSSVAPSPAESEADDDAPNADSPTRRRRNRNQVARDGDAGQTVPAGQVEPLRPSVDLLPPPSLPAFEAKKPSPSSNRVADRSNYDSSDDEIEFDIFAKQIAANNALREVQRAEIANLARAQADMHGARVADDRHPTPTPTLNDMPSASPTGILRGPNSTGDKFKMVDWETSSKLERVRAIEDDPYDASFASSTGDPHTHRSEPDTDEYGDRRAAPRTLPPLEYTPQPPQPIMEHAGIGLVPLTRAYNYDHIPSPPNATSSDTPEPMPMPSRSVMMTENGDVYPSADDPNRYSKLLQLQQQQQRQQAKPDPGRYSTIQDDGRF